MNTIALSSRYAQDPGKARTHKGLLYAALCYSDSSKMLTDGVGFSKISVFLRKLDAALLCISARDVSTTRIVTSTTLINNTSN